MIFKLDAFAIEIVELIAGTLKPRDLGSLHLICEEIHRTTDRSFSHICFTTVGTDLYRNSVQKLQNISEDEQLRHCVQTLLVKSVVFV